MVDKFQIGDIVICHNPITNERMKGEEFELTSQRQWLRGKTGAAMFAYLSVCLKDGGKWGLLEEEIRYPDSGNQVVSWESCPWKPTKELENA